MFHNLNKFYIPNQFTGSLYVMPVALREKSDSELTYLSHLKSNHIYPPSSLPYNLTNEKKNPSHLPPHIKKAMMKWMGNLTRGFFVECGAGDGEKGSNTLELELRGWQGLLVEPQPNLFNQLLLKRRKAFASNTCLAEKSKTMFMKYNEKEGEGKVYNREIGEHKLFKPVIECFPLHGILSAIGVSSVDFLSLDVGEKEVEILSSIPYHTIKIKSLIVDVGQLSQKDLRMTERIMRRNGYFVIERSSNDLYFIHKNYTNVFN